MILTKENILAEVQFTPELDSLQVNPCSIDLRLNESIVVGPGSTGIILTLEKVTLPDDIMAVVYPRSSTNRRGLHVHMTGVVDPGYSGHLVLPITNVTEEAVTLFRGERVASLIFHRMEHPVIPKKSKYHESETGAYVSDKDRELALIKQGMIQELKQEFPLRR